MLDGFFPQVDAAARPIGRARAGLAQLGLPYAQDAAVTRHLAAFLGRQLGAAAELEGFADRVAPGRASLHPTAVLFNGGVFKSAALAERTLATLNGWLAAEGGRRRRGCWPAPTWTSRWPAAPPTTATCAAARACAFAAARLTRYYVGVEIAMPAVPGVEPPVQALCVAPFGMEEGSAADVPDAGARAWSSASRCSFRFFGSSVRRQDAVGTLLERWAATNCRSWMRDRATLPPEGRRAGDVVPVHLHARVTEAGTLELEAVPLAGAERWKVEFDVRGERRESAQAA